MVSAGGDGDVDWTQRGEMWRRWGDSLRVREGLSATSRGNGVVSTGLQGSLTLPQMGNRASLRQIPF